MRFGLPLRRLSAAAAVPLDVAVAVLVVLNLAKPLVLGLGYHSVMAIVKHTEWSDFVFLWIFPLSVRSPVIILVTSVMAVFLVSSLFGRFSTQSY